jgi:hypothetical protein
MEKTYLGMIKEFSQEKEDGKFEWRKKGKEIV